MFSTLALGFLIGLQHALEVDHLAAVATLASGDRGRCHAARQAGIWGLGHTLTLFFFGGAVLITGELVPQRIALALEAAVGIMLVLLGADVLRRLVRERIHVHVHQHEGGRHVHLHRHRGPINHNRDPHQHSHPKVSGVRALLVGMMHGMAGSAALILLALGAVASPWHGLIYIALFGLGSMLGMILVGLVIALPLRVTSLGLTRVHKGLHGFIGLFTVGVGGYILYHSGGGAFFV